MKLHPPLFGVSEDKAFSEQEPGTARQAQNARAEDPISKREGLASRCGMRDFTTAKVAVSGEGNPVRLAMSVTFHKPVLSYANIADVDLEGTKEWGVEQQQLASRLVVVDGQNAGYFVFGSNLLVKISADGEIVWKLSLALKDEMHELSGLRIDTAGNLFVGTTTSEEYSDDSFAPSTLVASTEDGDGNPTNRIFRIVQITNAEKDTESAQVSVEWSTEGFVEDLYLRNGLVHYVQNRPARYESDLVVVEQFGVDVSSVSAQPRLLAAWGVAYPTNSLVVNSLGEIVVASEPFTARNTDPMFPELSRTSDAYKLPGFWTVDRNLARVASRKWSEYDAPTLPLANGAAVNSLPDLSGYGRDFSVTEANNITGDARTFTSPTFFSKVLGDFGGVHFERDQVNGLATGRNTTLDYRDRNSTAHRTAWPSYASHTAGVMDPTSAQFTFFLLVRIPREAARGAIIGQESAAADQPPVDGLRAPFSIVANRPESTSTTVAAEAGKLSLFDGIRKSAGNFQSGYLPSGPEAGGGVSQMPREADLLGIRAAPNNSASPEEPAVALIVLQVDNGVDPTAADDNATRGGWRVNGMPIDRCEGHIRMSLERVTLGFASDPAAGGDTLGTNLGLGRFDFLYALCLAREDPLSLTEPKVLEHQFERARNQRQLVLGTATSGNFTITVHYPDGTADQTTGNIAFNANAATVEAALDALAGIDGFDTTCTGTAVNSGGITIIWGNNEAVAKPSDCGKYQGIDMPTVTINNVSLAGGTVVASRTIEIDDGLAGDCDAHNAALQTELELIEGSIMHRFGVQHLLPQAGAPFEHPFAATPPVDPDAVDPTPLLTSTNALLVKYGLDGGIKWIVSDLGGVGYGLAIDEDDDLYSLGPKQASPVSAIEYRKIQDDGDGVTHIFSGAFTPDGFLDRHPKAVVDKFKRWYIPRFSSSPTNRHTVVVLDDAGASELNYDSDVDAGDVVPGLACAVAAPPPDYGDDPVERSEFLYIGEAPVGAGAVDLLTARKVRLVEVTHEATAPQETKHVVAANGDVKYANLDGSGYTAITGGTGALDPSSPLVTATRYGQKLYINDQRRTFVLDPREDTLEVLKAADGGEVPQRAHFIFNWGGRLGWSRLDDRPGFIKMAQVAKPDRLNLTPNPLFPGRAWLGATSSLDVGDYQDVINGVAPFSNKLFGIFGGRTLTLIQGDPTFGGQLVEIAHEVGGAYGKCWAFDKRERIFFMSNFGEIYLMSRSGGWDPDPISDMRVKRRLQDIDFAKFYVWAEWDWLDDTVHFWLIPFDPDDAAAGISHWKVDTKRGRLAFWEDTIGDADRNPSSLGTFDGPLPQDRRMVLGCHDGHLRVWEPTALDDDGVGIAFDTILPLNPGGTDEAYSFSGLQATLARTQGGCLAEYISAEQAEDLDNAERSTPFPLLPGFNAASSVQVQGNYCFLRLHQSAPGKRVFFDEMLIDGSAAGPRRPKTT